VRDGFTRFVHREVLGTALLTSAQKSDKLSGTVCAPPSLEFDYVVNVSLQKVIIILLGWILLPVVS
jgi:hypothetical protein